MKTCFPKSGHFVDPGRIVRGSQKKKESIKERQKNSRQHKADDAYYGKGKMIDEENSIGVVPPGVFDDKDKSISHGIISVLGRRRVMEDALKVALGAVGDTHGSYDFFSVYDLQGGATVCNSFGERMHRWVAEEVAENGCGNGLEYWREVIRKCFKKMEEELRVRSGVGGLLEVSAVLVLVGKEELVVANCGNSRAVICREGVAMPLSCAPKPDSVEDRKCVKAAGRWIINSNGSSVQGVPSISGSTGNCYLNPSVTSEADVHIYERNDVDDFVVIASDGLWCVLSDKLVCEVVRRCLQIKSSEEKRAAEAAAMLVNLAIARGSKDNISVIVVELKRSSTLSVNPV